MFEKFLDYQTKHSSNRTKKVECQNFYHSDTLPFLLL